METEMVVTEDIMASSAEEVPVPEEEMEDIVDEEDSEEEDSEEEITDEEEPSEMEPEDEADIKFEE